MNHLHPAARRALAAAAARERDDRARLYPDRIAKGQINAEDAQGDYEAWWAIAAWCAGTHPGTILSSVPGRDTISFAEMALASSRALLTADAAVKRASAENIDEREQRRDQIAEIHALINAHRAWLMETNAMLRSRTSRKEAA